MSLFDRLFGAPGPDAEVAKDKDYHPASQRYGWPGHSNDPKSADAGSPTTGQTWSELDPDSRGGDRDGWLWMTRVNLGGWRRR